MPCWPPSLLQDARGNLKVTRASSDKGEIEIAAGILQKGHEPASARQLSLIMGTMMSAQAGWRTLLAGATVPCWPPPLLQDACGDLQVTLASAGKCDLEIVTGILQKRHEPAMHSSRHPEQQLCFSKPALTSSTTLYAHLPSACFHMSAFSESPNSS